MTERTRIDPQVAYRMDGRTLMGLLPHVDQSDLHEIRQQFARFLNGMRPQPGITWQAAWNEFTGATAHRPGLIRYTTARCKECKGRHFNTRNIGRNLARTGQPYVCGECRGTGRGSQVRQQARYAPEPAAQTASEPTAAPDPTSQETS